MAKKKSKKKVVIFSVIGLIVLTLILLVVFGGKKETIISVQTEKSQKRNITQVVTASGKIQPVIAVTINPEVSGEIVELPVNEGLIVKKGQTLVKIKPDAYLAQLDRQVAALNSSKAQYDIQKASLAKAESDFKRQDEMFKKNLVSESDFEAVKANYIGAQAQLTSAKHSIEVSQAAVTETKTSLAKTTIQSPMDGTIIALNSKLGERVFGSGFSSGTAIMGVANLSSMEARVDVGENDVIMIALGDTARVEIDAFPNRKFAGVVYEIANSATTKGLGTQDEVVNFQVKIKIVDKDVVLRPGMSCTADIETDTRSDVFTVPIQCVTTRAKKMDEKKQDAPPENQNVSAAKQQKEKKDVDKPQEVIFIVENNVAKMVNVKTGISDDKYIEIKEGIKGDEEVVTGSYRAINRELEDGKAVKLENIGKKDNKDVK